MNMKILKKKKRHAELPAAIEVHVWKLVMKVNLENKLSCHGLKLKPE
jgi:hypothetical protein